jgi:XTP/dITP diphosphohydrolase
MCLLSHDCPIDEKTNQPKPQIFPAVVQGTIPQERKPRGPPAFGWDPIFIPKDENPEQQTFAEMGPEEKAKISHRTVACRMLREYLVGAGVAGS